VVRHYAVTRKCPSHGRPQQTWMSRVELERHIRDGEITDDSTIAAHTLIFLHEGFTAPTRHD
jgi:hypothetical protein